MKNTDLPWSNRGFYQFYHVWSTSSRISHSHSILHTLVKIMPYPRSRSYSRSRSRSRTRSPIRRLVERRDERHRSRSPFQRKRGSPRGRFSDSPRRRRSRSPRPRLSRSPDRKDERSRPRRHSPSPPRIAKTPHQPEKPNRSSPSRSSRSPPRRWNNGDWAKKGGDGFRWKEKGREDDNRRDRVDGQRLERGYREQERRRPRSPARDLQGEGTLGGKNSTEEKNSKTEEKKKKKKKEKAAQTIAPVEDAMIIVNVNDRLGTKVAIPCLASDPISSVPPCALSKTAFSFFHLFTDSGFFAQSSLKPRWQRGSDDSRTKSC